MTKHFIITNLPLDISKLNNFVSQIYRTGYDDLGKRSYLYWVQGKSTGGIYIRFVNDDVIQITNPYFSSTADYQLTNKIVAEILRLTLGSLIDNDGKSREILPLYDVKEINDRQNIDCANLRALSRDNGNHIIDSTTRNVHFGNRLKEEFKDLNDKQFKNKLYELILKVNYKIPDFEYGDVMIFTKSETLTERMKLIANEVDCLIDKYDYIILSVSDEISIMITNEILNTILPSNWTLVDEFTIVAPILSQNDWNSLLAKAKEFDMWDEYLSR